jgi:hypothetical protein
VLDHAAQRGNPYDGPQLAPPSGVIRRTERRRAPSRRSRATAKPPSKRPARSRCPLRGEPRKGRSGKVRQVGEHRGRVPPLRQVAHRQRSPHRHPQTPVPQTPIPRTTPSRRPRQGPDLERTRRPCPKPGQDRCTHRMITADQRDQHHSRTRGAKRQSQHSRSSSGRSNYLSAISLSGRRGGHSARRFGKARQSARVRSCDRAYARVARRSWRWESANWRPLCGSPPTVNQKWAPWSAKAWGWRWTSCS